MCCGLVIGVFWFNDFLKYVLFVLCGLCIWCVSVLCFILFDVLVREYLILVIGFGLLLFVYI